MSNVRGERKQQLYKNEGFTMVEVLISVIIVAVVFMMISRAFVTSANLNGKAHKRQQATALAQETAEVFKSVSFNQIEGTYMPLVGTEYVYPPISELPIADRVNYPEDSFKKKTYRQVNMRAEDGTSFDVEVVLNPQPYSQISGATSEVSYANTKGMGMVEGVDSLESIVIASEMNRYDKAIGETFLNRMSQTQKDALGVVGIANQVDKIVTSPNLKKDIAINISTSSNAISAECEVTYTYETMVERYNVYQASFPLDGVLDGAKWNWNCGNNIYIFVTPFTKENDRLTISNIGFTSPGIDGELSVILIRGTNSTYTNTDWNKMYNLKTVTLQTATKVSGVVTPISSTLFMDRTTNTKAPEDGKRKVYDLEVISNMKGLQNATVLASESAPLEDMPVYKQSNQKLRLMQMDVTIYEQGTFAKPIAEWGACKLVGITTTKAVD